MLVGGYTGTVFTPLKIGAGGFASGIDIAPDSTKVIRTDVGGAYCWESTQAYWRQLVTSTSMPNSYPILGTPGDQVIGFLNGVWEIRIAYSNTERFYMIKDTQDASTGATLGTLFRSDDKGHNWTTLSAFTPLSGSGYGANNSTNKANSEKMAIDPANPDILCISTQSGISITLDGGNTFNTNATVPAPTAGFYAGGLAFDPSGGTVVNSGQTQTAIVYLTSYGNGIWQSTTGISGTFTQIANGTSSPVSVFGAQVDSAGVYFCGENSPSKNPWMWKNSAWTMLTPLSPGTSLPSAGGGVVCVDPNNPGRLIISGPSGLKYLEQMQSYNNASWQVWSGTPTQQATDIPWLATADNIFLGGNNCRIDPNDGKVYCPGGVGVWVASSIPLSGTASFVWSSQSLGIEELVSNDFIAPPNGYPIAVCWDRPAFTLTNLNTYPSSYFGPTTVVQGNSCDYASNNPSFIGVLAFGAGVDHSGYSTDKGVTWNNFSGSPSPNGQGGNIAIASSTNMVRTVANNGSGGIFYTTDGGVNWAACPGLPTTNWQNSNFLCTRVIAADRVNIGTFYATYRQGNLASAAVYRTTDGGATWSQVFTGEIQTGGGFNGHLRSVPGIAGHIWYSVGSVTGAGNPPISTFLCVCTNAASANPITWTTISKANGFKSDIKEVFDFGFGAKKPGSSYPSIFIVGWLDGVYGIYRGDNFDPANNPGQETWTSIGPSIYPADNVDYVKIVSGDMNTYGDCYLGFAGSGFVRGKFYS